MDTAHKALQGALRQALNSANYKSAAQWAAKSAAPNSSMAIAIASPKKHDNGAGAGSQPAAAFQKFFGVHGHFILTQQL